MGSVLRFHLSYFTHRDPWRQLPILTFYSFLMPIDINLLRVSRGGNPDLVRQSQRNRFASVELVDEVIALDDVRGKWRA